MFNLSSMRKWIGGATVFALATLVMSVLGYQAVAQSFPSKPITLVVPYRAGGSTETMAQVFSKALAMELGQKVVVVTKPGGGGAVGATYVSQQPADGYTLLFSAVDALTWTPMTKPDIEYTVESFVHVAAVTEYQQAFVATPDKPYKTLDELIEYSRANPGLNVADQGGLSKAFILFIAKKEGLDWTAIPTKGGGEMIPFLLGGKVDFGWSGGVHNKHGDKIHVLASCNAERLSSAPDAPSIKERYGIAMPAAALVSAPAGTPAEVVAMIDEAIGRAMQDEDFNKILDNLKFPNKYVGADQLKIDVQDIIAGLKEVMAAM